MIWVRRVFAVFIGAAFAVVLAVLLVLQAVSSTVARPGFYPDQLAEADAYRFVTGDLVDALIEDTRQLDAGEFNEDLSDNPIASSGLTTQQIADALRRALPPEDLEAAVAPALEQLAEYLAGERDSLTITIALGGNIENAVRELTTLMRESGSYELLLERELEPIFHTWASEALPPDESDPGWVTFLGGSSGDARHSLVRVFTRIVTPEWLAGQVEETADQLTGYLVGRSDAFELRVAIDDAQAAAAADEIEAIITEADAYDLAQDTVIGPAVEDHVDAVVELPYGLEVPRDEVLAALREAMPKEWVDQQVAVLAAGVAAYITGQSKGFTAEFDVAGAKDSAAVALTAAAGASLASELERLPACSTAAEIAAAREALRSELPACLPPGFTVGGVVEAALPVIGAAIDDAIVARVPDTVRYTERDLRADLERDAGPDGLVALDDVRALFTTDWTYTDADLRAELSEDDEVALDDVRAFLGDGYVLEVAAEDREDFEEALEGAREVADGVRSGRWVALVVGAILLAAVGALGGTSWRGRVSWSAATLLAAAAPIALVSGPIYQGASGAVFEALRDEIATDPGTAFALTTELLFDKLLELVEVSADDFAGGIARNSLVLAAVGAVALSVSLSWDRITEAIARRRS